MSSEKMHSPVLEVTEVDQAFRAGFWLKRTQILHGLSFAIPGRSIVGFLGANGAGKTTLIHLLVGLRRPVRGSVRVFGCDAQSPEARARIGYLPERPYFHDHLTGEALLKYFGALAGMQRPKVLSRIPAVLSAVGMSHAGKTELRKYSKGMLQRIGIAQALLHDPEFLVLDEPMSGLDPLGRKEMRELILKLAADGRTVFFSSHVIPDVEAICDQVVLIQKGRLIGNGPIGQFLAQGPLQTEIAFSGLKMEDILDIPELLSPRQIPDAIRATVSGQGSVQLVLQRLLQRQANILWVTPVRPSLESLFGAEGGLS
ncbi:MAG: ABC transporter ATP-binding protein [Oligoflexia bacterium]|nr:ABC transporter ATP-binding protein [Oligoflexia bacterium]